MERKIRFQYIDEDTHTKKTRVFSYEFPDFKETIVNVNGHLFPITVEEQMMEYLDTTDKQDFMVKNRMLMILNYDIYTKKERVSEKDSFLEFLHKYYKEIGLTDEDVVSVVQYASMSKTIFGKRKSNWQKLNEILDGLRLSYKAQSAVLDRLSEEFKKNHENALNHIEDVHCLTE